MSFEMEIQMNYVEKLTQSGRLLTLIWYHIDSSDIW